MLPSEASANTPGATEVGEANLQRLCDALNELEYRWSPISRTPPPGHAARRLLHAAQHPPAAPDWRAIASFSPDI
jgi:hypothetical protein